jgi:hypothetical protein
LASSIKTFTYNAPDADIEEDKVVDYEAQNEVEKQYLPNINSDEEFEAEALKSLLTGETSYTRRDSICSVSSGLSNRTEKSMRARNEQWSDDPSSNEMVCNSVAQRLSAKGKKELLFKYKSCSICLSDFVQSDKVKVVPRCGHTFHDDCLESWLQKRFRCPNCNTDI